MKNFFVSLTLFTALIFFVSCGGSNTEGGNTATSETSCKHEGAFNCKENAVLKCENNEWQKIEQCTEDQECNPVKGICETVGENEEEGDTDTDNGNNKYNTAEECTIAGGTWDDTDISCTKTESCTGLPENAEWNSVSSITQSYDGSSWTPSTIGVYNEESSIDECRFKCKTDYHFENHQCLYNTKTKVACEGLPENAEWNSVSSITQSYDGSSWTPSTIGVYNEESSIDECRFKCKTDYHFENHQCLYNTKTKVACEGLPENAVWNTASNITQIWNGTEWEPSAIGSYNETEKVNECRFKCVQNYDWTGMRCKGLLEREICTGQNKCYETSLAMTCPAEVEYFFGQDTQYAKLGFCAPKSFSVKTISNQGIVIDNNTGLEWQQTPPNNTYYWNDAKTYCDSLFYGGYSDWRLPSMKELMSIIDYGRLNPAIDTTYFPQTTNDEYFEFWADFRYLFDSGGYSVEGVDFNSGHSFSASAENWKFYVRCVRGESDFVASLSSSTENGNQIITDSRTGLIWQKTYVTDKTWQEALSYCENLNYAGHSDWRLPNMNELSSLLNYPEYGKPYTNFPDTPDNYHFWSSTTSLNDTTRAWVVEFNYGYLADGKDGDDHWSGHVRCVR